MNVITLETKDLTLQTAFRLILKFKYLSDLIIHADVFVTYFDRKCMIDGTLCPIWCIFKFSC